MASFNRVILIGNLTRDPEVKYLQSGTAVCEVGLAVTEKYKDKSGEQKEDTVFVDVSFWGRTAEVVGEYCKKGVPLFVEGRLKLDTWEKDGKKNSKLRVTGERMQLLGSRGERPSARDEAGQSSTHSDTGTQSPSEDIPF